MIMDWMFVYKVIVLMSVVYNSSISYNTVVEVRITFIL